MTRQAVPAGAPWGETVGYARAVRVGPHVAVAGTTATDAAGEPVARGDAYAQARYALGRIEAALREVGAELSDVVRTRIFVTDITQWEAVGRAHAEVFGDTRPASTMVEVARLIDARLVVEIEADALVSDAPVADAAREPAVSAVRYDGRRFRAVATAANGEVDGETVFHYRQQGDVVWATYAGGGVRLGTLVAAVDAAGCLDMRYAHVNAAGALMTGTCRSTPERLPDGRLRLHERWRWTSGDQSAGTSVVEEVEA